MRKKLVVNYFVDVGLAISFLLVAITGILKFPLLIRVTGLAQNFSLYRTLTFIHDWSGLLMSVLVIVHIVLHWKWIVVMSKKMFGRKQ